jgi:hypothetical protein
VRGGGRRDDEEVLVRRRRGQAGLLVSQEQTEAHKQVRQRKTRFFP